MSTRCRIGVPEGDSIRSIYCHHDGYPSHTGKMLVEHYMDESVARALIALGDISFLSERVAPPEGADHSYGHARLDTTIAYIRDRGERECWSTLHGPNAWPKTGAEYAYLWTPDGWMARHGSDDWQPATAAVEADGG